jgi:hypothetical protein
MADWIFFGIGALGGGVFAQAWYFPASRTNRR